MIMKCDNFAIYGKLSEKWNPKTRIKLFELNIREISLFENQQKSITKIGRKGEFNYFYTLITYLILI